MEGRDEGLKSAWQRALSAIDEHPCQHVLPGKADPPTPNSTRRLPSHARHGAIPFQILRRADELLQRCWLLLRLEVG